MQSNNDGRPIARASVICKIIDRPMHGLKEAAEGCDEDAFAAFCQAAIELGEAEFIEFSLVFDGSQTALEIFLGRWLDSKGEGPKN